MSGSTTIESLSWGDWLYSWFVDTPTQESETSNETTTSTNLNQSSEDGTDFSEQDALGARVQITEAQQEVTSNAAASARHVTNLQQQLNQLESEKRAEEGTIDPNPQVLEALDAAIARVQEQIATIPKQESEYGSELSLLHEFLWSQWNEIPWNAVTSAQNAPLIQKLVLTLGYVNALIKHPQVIESQEAFEKELANEIRAAGHIASTHRARFSREAYDPLAGAGRLGQQSLAQTPFISIPQISSDQALLNSKTMKQLRQAIPDVYTASTAPPEKFAVYKDNIKEYKNIITHSMAPLKNIAEQNKSLLEASQASRTRANEGAQITFG